MTFADRLKEIVEQGVAASKDLAVKAGAKAQDLGEQGMLMLEIKKAESQAQKLIGRLGSEVYQAFVDRDQPELDRDNEAIKQILVELAAVKETIEHKEAELRIRRAQP